MNLPPPSVARPILFSPTMVAAIRAGKKTQTRRIIKRPEKYSQIRYCGFCCPYGVPGSRLWIRETHFLYGCWKKNGQTSAGKQRWRFLPNAYTHVLFTDNPPRPIETSKQGVGWYKRPSIHMHRAHSRLLVEITAVRVERLSEIPCSEIRAEGFNCPKHDFQSGFCTCECWALRDVFKKRWEAINGPGSWGENPWVWVIDFKRIDQ